MSSLGKSVRLGRIFARGGPRVLTVAADHLINYRNGLPEGLRAMPRVLAGICEGGADAVTINKGIAMRFWGPHAGRIPLIIQSIAMRPGESEFAAHATVEEVLALGGDAIAVSIFLRGPQEMRYIRQLADVVRAAQPCGLPVIPHVYPLSEDDGYRTVSNRPEHLAYAVRMALELGADVIKTPYTGDATSYRDIVAETPVPVVAAGGPQCSTLDEAEAMLHEVAQTGAAGATVGRNVWGFTDIPHAVRRLKAALAG